MSVYRFVRCLCLNTIFRRKAIFPMRVAYCVSHRISSENSYDEMIFPVSFLKKVDMIIPLFSVIYDERYPPDRNQSPLSFALIIFLSDQ